MPAVPTWISSEEERRNYNKRDGGCQLVECPERGIPEEGEEKEEGQGNPGIGHSAIKQPRPLKT